MSDYYFTIKKMPEDMRPRERLLKDGEKELSDEEILAIIINIGAHNLNAIDLAKELLLRYNGSLRALKEAGIEELMTVKGIGPAKAVTIKAALELGRRMSLDVKRRIDIYSPEDVKNAVMEEMRYFDREHFRVMYLDRKGCLITMEDISIGGLHSSIVHPREVFKTAVKRSAAKMILIHNHPSGDPTPSQEDVDITCRLAEVGKLMGIEVIDHVIIGDNTISSLKRLNMI